MLSDPVTGKALWLTAKVMVVSWLVQTPISLLLGTFTAGRQRYRAVLAVLYFLLVLMSAAAIAIAFKAILDANFGLSQAVRLPWLAQDWLGSPDLVLYVIIFVDRLAVRTVSHAALPSRRTADPNLILRVRRHRRRWPVRQFVHITLPQLRYTIVTSSTLMLVGSLTYFDLVFVLTGGGPGHASRILALHMYLTGFSSATNSLQPPANPTLASYGLVLQNDFLRYFLNSVIVTTGTVGITVLVSLMAAYAIVRGNGRLIRSVFAVFFAPPGDSVANHHRADLLPHHPHSDVRHAGRADPAVRRFCHTADGADPSHFPAGRTDRAVRVDAYGRSLTAGFGR